jgi:type I restriction enzyme S subunit
MEQVKKGYKKTELGLIPEDWKLNTVESLTPRHGKYHIVDGPFGSNLKTEHYRKKGIPIITSGYVTNGYFNAEVYLYVDLEKFLQEKRSAVKGGDIVMAKIGARCGASAILPLDHQEGILSGNALKITVDENKFSTKLIWQILFNKYQKGDLENITTTGAQPAVSMSNLKKLLIPIPPTLTEQKAIATALSDVDELINNLEKLIAKKKAIKQGAMQQLLTPPNKGGKRLEGFNGEWVEKRLEEISKIKTGSKNNQDKIEDGLYPFFVRSQTIERINTYSYDCEAILVPGEGGIGSIFHYINGKFEVHQRVYKISDFEIDVVGKYIFLQMLFSFGKHAMTNSVKATVDSLRLPTFEEFAVPIPPTIEEQKYISRILTEMDGELEQLENRKSKYQSIKQGMMQELLTGKTRLVL